MVATVAIVNASTVISDDAVASLLAPLQLQVGRDLVQSWPDAVANLMIKAKGEILTPEVWALAILDDTDQAGILGFHDLTSAGQPLGKVFAKSDIENGEQWTVTVSHELCEMLCDPQIDQIVTTVYEGKPATTIREVCDAVEGNSYAIDGVMVSDFVTPNFYDNSKTDGVKYDFLSVLSAPMTLAQGGYMSLQDGSGNWTQVFGEKVTTWKRVPPHGSRRERLRAGPKRWRRSTAI